MGTEALAKQARRDIRRAFAPEATAEVVRFLESVKKDFSSVQAEFHNFTHLTFWQRFRWLLTGRWS